MTILMVGGGGREHALIRKLKESPRVTRILCAPGNGGIRCDAECFPVAACDIPGMVALAKREEADLVVVAPDDPLVPPAWWMRWSKTSIRAFGPNAAAAQIEGEQGLFQRTDEKARHPHGRIRRV